MIWTVDTRTVRRHDATGDLPQEHQATIEVGKPAPGDPVTLAEYRTLLATAVNNLNIPDNAMIIEGTRLDISWE